MRIYYQNVNTVLDFLKERGYAKQTLLNHENFYNKLAAYLEETQQKYHPELGKYILSDKPEGLCLSGNRFEAAACIAKLNDVYENGCIGHALVSPRKDYSSILLSESFQELVAGFLTSKETCFKPSQLENARRRCNLFMKYLQSRGITDVTAVTYDILRTYHNELSHLKKGSRIVEESTLHQFLEFLSETGHISQSLYLFMHALETDTLVTMVDLPAEACERIEASREESRSFPADEFLTAALELISLHYDAGYAPHHVEAFRRAIMQFYLFLDLHDLGYSDAIASAWLYSDAVKSVFQGSSWQAARRILFVFSIFALNGQASFEKSIPRGISGISELPEWSIGPLFDYAECRRKTRIDENTVKNDIYSILRFCRYIVANGLTSYDEITGKVAADFNLADVHGSPEGKNACNGRIRHFLKYLHRKGILPSSSAYLALGCTAASVETIVVTLTTDEVETIRRFIGQAVSSLEIRDSAVMLLGTEMGMRGSDIVALRLHDIDWKNRVIRFCQGKTDTDVWVPMPVAAGNALFKYLHLARPKKAKSDHVFVGFNAPFSPLTRNICYGAIRRILPGRNVSGSGFHVTRKTFSTNRLRNGARPGEIADVIGHRGTKSLVHYLSLDDERMALCPLSLADLKIQVEGGTP